METLYALCTRQSKLRGASTKYISPVREPLLVFVTMPLLKDLEGT
jgi:hypothetical protein